MTVAEFLRQEAKDKKKARNNIQVDAAFFRKLWSILKILIPSVFSAEAFYLVLVAASLLGRTYADVWMITNTTMIERCASRHSDHRQTVVSSSAIRRCLVATCSTTRVPCRQYRW